MSRIVTDLCVIGAGSGGLSVAAGAVQMGARTVLIEGAAMGGDCLNAGCVPSKALLSAARSGATWAGARDHVAAAIATIAPHDSQERFEGLGVTVLRDWARFTGPRTVVAGKTEIAARRFVIATGASAAVPPVPGIDTVPYLTNDTLWSLADRPDHLVILGGGPIGMEMAEAHARLGARVTLIEADRVLNREDPEAAALVRAAVAALGVEIREGARVQRIAAEGGVTLYLDDGVVTGSHLLVAAGRRPNLARLDLAAAGVAHEARGVTVDAGLRSVSNRRVFAVGDAAGGGFTHQAGYHAGIVLRRAMFGLPARARTDHIPRVTYTRPELAQIGPTEAEARATHGAAVTVMREDFARNDRAVAEGATGGFAKLVLVKGRPVGATIVAPDAGDLIAPWALVIANRLALTAVSATVLPYPTRAEIHKRLAGAYLGARLFQSPVVKRVVRTVQRLLP